MKPVVVIRCGEDGGHCRKVIARVEKALDRAGYDFEVLPADGSRPLALIGEWVRIGVCPRHSSIAGNVVNASVDTKKLTERARTASVGGKVIDFLVTRSDFVGSSSRRW